MSELKIFDREDSLPDSELTAKEQTLLGFDSRYERVSKQLRLLLRMDELDDWNQKHHGGKLTLNTLVGEQYPLVIFHGDVGTGKTVMAECIANRLVDESKTEDAVLFKLSTRVRGSGKVGEMGTLLVAAFENVKKTAGKSRRAILVIDEADSLAATRTQDHSHHEDKVAVNTLIQGIDAFREYNGRVVVILCTNRASVVDPALQRRAAIIEEFSRPSEKERRQLFDMDLAALKLKPTELDVLVQRTGAREGQPGWTYSDIRTRLYPAALAEAFPDGPLRFDQLRTNATELKPSPVLEDG